MSKYDESLHFYIDTRKVNAEIKERIKKFEDSIRKDSSMYVDVTTALGEHLSKFVPKDTMTMAESMSVDAHNGLKWHRINPNDGYNVAYEQYTEEDLREKRHGTHYHHDSPLESDHWADPYHQAIIWDDFIKDATRIVRRHLKEKE